MQRIKRTLIYMLAPVICALLCMAAVLMFGKTVNAAADENPALPDTHAHTTACTEGGNLTDGSYYLGDDITGNITVTGEVTLCLNGHTITGSGNGSVITVSENANFTLCDCAGTGIITGGTGIDVANKNYMYGGGVYVKENGSFTMTGGTIEGNTAMGVGGGVYVNGGTFIMNGGTISGNSAHYGGGVSIDK